MAAMGSIKLASTTSVAGLGAVHRERGIEPPVQRLGALGRRDLHGLDQVEGEAVRILALGAIARPGQSHGTRAEPQSGTARLVTRLGADRHLQLAARLERRVEHEVPRDQRPVPRHPCDQLDIVGSAREHRIDIELPITDHDYLARRAETRRRRRMDEKAQRLAVARRTQTATAAVPTREVHLRRVLSRHHPTPRARRRRALRQFIEDRRRIHLVVVQKTMTRHLARAGAADMAQNQRSGRYHPIHQPVTTGRQTNVTKGRRTHPNLRLNTNPHRPSLNHNKTILINDQITCVHPVAKWAEREFEKCRRAGHRHNAILSLPW